MIVADATLLIHFALPVAPEVDAERARAIYRQDSDWRVPSLWASEVRHVALKYVRGGHLSPEAAEIALDALSEVLAGRVMPIVHAEVFRASLSLDLSAYDAEYAALAARLGVPLVTSDRRLREAVPSAVSPSAFVGTE